MNVIMKTMKYFWLLCLAILPFSLIACSDDDDEGSTPMTIDKIFLEDAKSTVPDREVDFARLGQMLRIQGSGFSGLKAIYVNGYKTQFNTTMVTDNNIWVTLSGKTPGEERYRVGSQLYDSCCRTVDYQCKPHHAEAWRDRCCTW